MGKNLYPLTDRFSKGPIGSKARNLGFLIKNRYAVPVTFVCPACETLDLNGLKRELEALTDRGKAYAVRSSADVEDGPDHSFAGLFKSVLDVQGIDNLLEAVQSVRESADSPEVKKYMTENGIEKPRIHMAVLIQEMVEAVCSGVAFSKNPLTGFSETLVEACPGKATDQACREPLRWVEKWGSLREKPETDWMPEELVWKVVGHAKRLEEQVGCPVDVEWAFDGDTLYLLQVRPITKLGIPVYSNAISKEMLPGVIKPLVWSVNTALNNDLWVKLIYRATGRRAAEPKELTGHFYGRAYFNMEVFGKVFEWFGMPRESLEILMGIEMEGPDRPRLVPGARALLYMPRLLAMGVRLLSLTGRLPGLERRKTQKLGEIEERLSGTEDPGALLGIFDALFEEITPVVYFNVAVPLLTMAHHRLLCRMVEKAGLELQDFEIPGVTIATSVHDPNRALVRLHQKHFSNGGPETEQQKSSLMADVEAFLDRFGYHSDSNSDFSVKTWRETPDLIIDMIRAASDPGMGDKPLNDRTKKRLPLFRRMLLERVVSKTGCLGEAREMVSMLYSSYYALFRQCFLKLGNRLGEAGKLDEPGDIFYIYLHELKALIEEDSSMDLAALAAERKEWFEGMGRVNPPGLIFGNEAPPVLPVGREAYHGVPVSLGVYEGPSKVLRGLGDHEKLHKGDVLIIPYSDVGWTPLFCKAGAVVSESGGVLSHGAIMAREYGIPAVVSAKGACGIPDNTRVHVDGKTGIVTVRS